MITLDTVKTYLRVSTTAEDGLLQGLIAASDSYMEGAVSNYSDKYENSDDKWQYKADLAQLMLIADWYEHRLQEERPVSGAVNLLLTQLQIEGTM